MMWEFIINEVVEIKSLDFKVVYEYGLLWDVIYLMEDYDFLDFECDVFV